MERPVRLIRGLSIDGGSMFRNLCLKTLLFISIIPLSSCVTKTASTVGSGANLNEMQSDVQVFPLGALGTSESINTEHLVEQTMDNSDEIKLMEAVDTNPTYKASSWVNAGTGARYTVVPTTNLINMKGNKHCRRYRVIVVVNGQKGHLHGVACKQENGNWQKVS